MTLLLVIAGAAVGAPLRYLTDRFVQGRHDQVFPWGTFLVNMVGSLLLGVAAGALTAGGPEWVLPLVGIGLCGSFTTFSTFGYETVRLAEEGSLLVAGLNVVGTVVACLLACAAGWAGGWAVASVLT